jgi:hypothetical protein
MKVAALLDDFPELETLLYEIAPSFAKLRSPMLRRTVAKATSLRQAAKVAEVELAMLINRLREAAGQSALTDCSSDDTTGATAPNWVERDRIKQTLDARAQIERGEQPMAAILADLKKTAGTEVYELLTPFAPAPLVDLAVKQGFEAWSTPPEDGLVRTFFRRIPQE